MLNKEILNTIYSHWEKSRTVSTDSRDIKKDSIFFALKGDTYNGNQYALDAIRKGACLAVVDESHPEFLENEKMILVPNSLQTLQEIAKKYRETLKIPFIAITGSNGKTTTKELIYSILSSHFSTYATKGNLNNHIGIPLTILQIPPKTEIAIIEMGANHIKEITSYCSYAQPTHGIITNIGKAHIGEFGSFKKIIQAKTELYDYLSSSKGFIFYVKDDKVLSETLKKRKIKTYSYGFNPSANVFCPSYQCDQNGMKIKIVVDGNSFELQSSLFGDYNVMNILASFSVAHYFKTPPEKIIAAIQNYVPKNNRSEKITQGTNEIILDSYNANPTSMKATITFFHHQQLKNSYYILGSMKELGKYSETEHQKIIHILEKLKVKKNVVLVGEEFSPTKHPYLYFSDIVKLNHWLKQQIFKNCFFLLKGSRSVRLEECIQFIKDGH